MIGRDQHPVPLAFQGLQMLQPDVVDLPHHLRPAQQITHVEPAGPHPERAQLRRLKLIRQLVGKWQSVHDVALQWEQFDVRWSTLTEPAIAAYRETQNPDPLSTRENHVRDFLIGAT